MGLLVSLALMWPSAGANNLVHSYHGGTDCGQFKTCPLALFVCTRGSTAAGALIVCIDGGHIQPDAVTGEASVTITDGIMDDVGAYVCQDNDEDGDCGSVGRDLGATFCGTQYITDIAHDGLWDPSITLYVLPGGELTTGAACGTSGTATTGIVQHS